MSSYLKYYAWPIYINMGNKHVVIHLQKAANARPKFINIMNGLAYEKSHLDVNTAILIHLVHSQTLNKK